MDDKLAPQATSENKTRKVIIAETGTFVYAYFEGDNPEYNTICEFYGWNGRRQIVNHLDRMGYENVESA